MVSLIKKDKGSGKPQWYLVRSKRVNGEPRIVWQKYIGTAKKIKKILENKDKIKIHSFEYGRTVSLLSVSQELNFIDIVNKHTKKKKIKGLTVGQYILLLILGRCNKPLSKTKTADWFENSFLKLKWVFKHKINCQNFLNHMKYIDKEAMRKIEEDISRRLIKLGIKPKKVIWDTSNFFTYIEKGGDIPRKGKSKQKRNDKNLVSVGLAVSEENIPFFHETYEGNKQDAKEFSEVIEKITKRLKSLKFDIEDVSLVIDKGNNSKENIKDLEMHVVGSIKLNQVKDHLKTPITDYEFLYKNKKKHKIY